jgi:hypothetical protein
MSFLNAQRISALIAARPASFSWDPTQLGAPLVGFYDFENNAKITTVSGAISAITDSANASNSLTQSSTAARPALQISSQTGRQVAQFDGAGTFLQAAPVPATYPLSGATEWIAICTQDASDATARQVIGGGSGSLGASQGLTRQATTNRLQVAGGNGSTAVSALGPPTALASGRCILRARWDGGNELAEVNGFAGAAVALGQTMANTRFRVGATSSATPGAFWLGAVSAILIINGNLSVADLNNLYVWAAMRLGL